MLFGSNNKEEVKEQWDAFLHQPHYVSAQYLQFKNHGLGSTPMESYHNLMMRTPHVSQSHYSEVETTKRDVVDFAKTKFRNGISERQDRPRGFVYPNKHWSNFTQNAKVFRKFPTFRNPLIKF